MTTRTATLDLSDAHRLIVLAILRAHLPPHTSVAVFGSRATGRARRYSDLDLAITAPAPLTADQQAILAEAFADSDLPWTVDIVDTRTLTPAFHAIVANGLKLPGWPPATGQ